MSSVFYKLKLQSHTPIGAIKEGSKLSARQVVLHVARVPVIRDVEDRESRPSFIFLTAKRNVESFRYEQIEREESWKSSAFISWTNEVLIFVQQ